MSFAATTQGVGFAREPNSSTPRSVKSARHAPVVVRAKDAAALGKREAAGTLRKPPEGHPNTPTGTVKPMLPKRTSFKVCFCDIDGTLVHNPTAEAEWVAITGRSVPPGCFTYVERATGEQHKVLRLPPTSTGSQGVISIKTLTKLDRLRKGGVRLVLITGARLSTFLTRMAFLPAADAYVCENGGRIFYPNAAAPVAFPIGEDMNWRQRHNETVGPPDTDGRPPLERPGTLWDLYRQLDADGWSLDASSYTTNFRVKANSGKTPDDIANVVNSLQPGLTSSYNIGKADFYPVTSGKRNAAQHIVDGFGSNMTDAFLLCDDDNDMELAVAVEKAFLLSISSDFVQKTVTANPDKFFVSQTAGIIATEEVLEQIESHNDTLGQ
ncbi:hypothetical protein ABBQ38_014143 [Trebouxia sp. C0009 RCD-2024]